MTIPFNIDLGGRVAVVTGAGGVLCGAMARALGECNARVALLDIDDAKAAAVADDITRAGGTAMALACDVLSAESLARARDAIAGKWGTCSILVNGAGGNHPRGTTAGEFFSPADLRNDGGSVSFFDLDPAGFRFVFDLNVLGTLVPTQIFGRDMAAAGTGCVVNISSMNAFTPLTKIPAYSAAKAAVSNLTQWLAVHFSTAGVRVNAIAPGFFLTEQNRSLMTEGDGSLTPRAEKILGRTPMRRFGTPADLIGTLLWLVDDASSGFVSGAVIPVDGGFSAYSGV